MTAHTATEPRALTTYLRRATWGLPDGRRQELWDELEEHLLTRADHLTFLGLSPTQAMTQAIRELGPPARVTLGMARVYTMPKLVIAAGTLALGLSAGLYALAGGGNGAKIDLPVLLEVPAKPQCLRGTKPTDPDLQIISQKDGITCYRSSQPLRGVFMGHTDLQKVVQAQGGKATILKDGRLKVSYPGASWFTIDTYFTVDKQRYYYASPLASSLMTSALPKAVSLSGYQQPALNVGSLRINFGTAAQNIGQNFYNGFGLELVSTLVGTPAAEGTSVTLSTYSTWDDASQVTTQRVQTDLRPGEVVMAVLKRAGNNYVTLFSPVASDGTVMLEHLPERVRFVPSLDQLGPYSSGGRISALLVRVTNIPLSDLRAGIFVPAQATSDAR
ncbi:hypothetical protein HNQ07_000352 [Deinococcus metalli]|uniref:Uncharacterized protein n=1 Tax=Deinococcus metalli TaxID=1141878 RepID=A0A7W8KBW6_9DEIO|nr:permease prefix domain 1-containing protein [Deinococcus metalli]MBB5374908.1 hypothetical protein [Deinococcus metalli]GHF32812.1 hypothetical protein GCM10017781_06890 [Deinococcus metalli]